MKRKDPREFFHDRIAHRYEDIYNTHYWQFYRELSWKHLMKFLPKERPAWALDIGCGPGWFGKKLRKAGFNVTFLDISIKMLETARMELSKDKRPEKVEFVQADMEDLSMLDDEKYIFATAQGDVLGFCRSPKKAVKELKRVLAPNGKAVISVDHAAKASRKIIEKGDLKELDYFIRTGKTTWLAKKKEERFQVKMFNTEELKNLFEKEGFKVMDLIGKTILFQRTDEKIIMENSMDKLIKLEEKVYRKENWLGLASHIQIVVKKPS